MATIGQELGGRYRLEALLGAGGMATVYRAHDTRLDRAVAVKVLSPNLAADETLARRFEQEARFLAAVNNPSVVNVYDVGEADGEPFFVMELVDGETLGDRIAREGVLSPDEVVPMVASIAAGLRVLHRDGFVHRDVKPGNILLPREGGAKLADFGLVRPERASDLTAPGTAVGTLAYLAPELLRGEPATPSSDVYALGVVAYEALTARLPYPVETLIGLVEGHAQPAPPASSIAPWLTDAFDEPFAAVLRPGARPTVDEFTSALQRAEAAWRAAGAARPGTAGVVSPPASEGVAATVERVDTAAVTQPGTAVTTARDRFRASPAAWLLAVAAAAVAGLVLFAALSGPPQRPPTAGPAPTPTRTPTRPPATARPTPRPATNPAAAVAAAVRDFKAAVEAARGGREGLKGGDANDLSRRAARIEEAARDGDGEEAQEQASELVDQVNRVTRDVREEDAARLRDAAAAVDRAASRLPED